MTYLGGSRNVTRGGALGEVGLGEAAFGGPFTRFGADPPRGGNGDVPLPGNGEGGLEAAFGEVGAEKNIKGKS